MRIVRAKCYPNDFEAYYTYITKINPKYFYSYSYDFRRFTLDCLFKNDDKFAYGYGLI